MILLASATYGQKENWDVYMAQYEKGPGSTVLDMSLKESSNKDHFRFLLVAGVKFNDCDQDGLPTEKQFPILYSISDSVKTVIDKNKTNILAGTFTYQCERSDYYYISDTINIRELLLKLNTERFKNFTFTIRIKEDPKWEAYLKFLYPNDETLEFMSDSKVVAALTEQGDKLEKPRKVDHWIYFNNEQDRNCFLTYANQNKFKIESKEKIKGKIKAYSLQISRNDKVDLSEISKITKELRQNAKKCNGDYDGWEIFVIKN